MPTTNSTGPESIVTSLEWSRRLRDAGWQLEWSWMFREGYMLGDDGEPTSWLLGHGRQPHDKHTIPAPTAEEVLRSLPGIMKTRHGLRALRIYPTFKGQWAVDYESHFTQWEDTLANAAAAMWIHLKQNNLLPSDK